MWIWRISITTVKLWKRPGLRYLSPPCPFLRNLFMYMCIADLVYFIISYIYFWVSVSLYLCIGICVFIFEYLYLCISYLLSYYCIWESVCIVYLYLYLSSVYLYLCFYVSVSLICVYCICISVSVSVNNLIPAIPA